jgi:rhamnogalacturonyl hydrolase YesR
MKKPLDIVKNIGDKLIRDTPFRYCLEVAPCKQTFENENVCGMRFVDFGRSFGLGRPALAYAWTEIVSSEDREVTLEIEHNDGCKVWVNGVVAYTHSGARAIRLQRDERSIIMSFSFKASLHKGVNTLLIKSETEGRQWCVYLQQPSLKGAVRAESGSTLEIGLKHAKDVDPKIAELTNWLVIGPFANDDGLATVHPPEHEFRFGFMYPGRDGSVTWTIPKIEILGNVIDPKPWGTNYNWNYHNGGTAWAMQVLAETSGEAKYLDYADRFCDYHLEGKPFVRYQVATLNAVTCANHFIVDTPLLDFTLAPALPFIYRLRKGDTFNNRVLYSDYIAQMLAYAREGQIRLPGSCIYTRTTPVKHTTWVDDMFMGIPFLVQAAQYASSVERQAFLEDAATQTLAFTAEVWDEAAELYMHAHYENSPAKLPHWSRCNGWAIWAMSEILQILPIAHANYAPILAHYRRHINSLLRWQSVSGFWHNVLDRPDSPEEVSGTAIFVMALARGLRRGWLSGEPYQTAAQKGWQALTTEIDGDGTVHKICMGTMCSEDEEYYVKRPFYDNDTHGLFAVLFAGIEMHLLREKGSSC